MSIILVGPEVSAVRESYEKTAWGVGGGGGGGGVGRGSEKKSQFKGAPK